MNYYIDFDYTLFDTYRFREGLYEILESNGLDKSVIKLIPETNNNEQRLLNIRDLFEFVGKEKGISLEKLISPLENLYSKCAEFLYDDSIEFLDYLKSKGNKLYLLTWGNKEFQQEKVKNCNIDKYFEEMIFTEKLKYTLDSIDYTNGIFIDDSIRDLEGLYGRNAKKVIRIRRQNGKNSKEELNIKGISEYTSLRDLKKRFVE